MLLLDVSHTSHTRARTGIQRVTRALATALGPTALPVTHDPYLGSWRALEPWEQANLTATAPAKKRGAQWPLTVRLRGRVRRLLDRSERATVQVQLPPADYTGLIVPEIFSAGVAKALPALSAAVRGPRVAIFHDAIALKFPELTPAKTIARFPAYLRELLAFDGIVAVSEDSRACLLDYWRWLGVAPHPPVRAVPLAIDLPPAPTPAVTRTPEPPVILSVGSIEGRKNHLALLDACETLWAAGQQFTLHLVGLAHPQTGRAALQRLRALQAAGRPIRYAGPASDAALEAAYAECRFTVYPSLIEGFGLPVLESLARGKPCVCSGRGALGESAAGGGCVTLDRVTAPNLATAIGELFANPGRVSVLTAAARSRNFRTWSTYAADVISWLNELPRRH